MRRFSHILSFLAVAMLLLLTGSGAKASTVDPKSGLGGGGSCASLSENSLTQTFTITSTEFDCTVDFQNLTGVAIQSLSVVFPTQFAMSCVIDSFQGPDGTFSNPPFNTATSSGSVCNYSGAGPLPDTEGTAPGVILPATCGDGCTGGIYSQQFGYPGTGTDFSDADKAAGIVITVIATPVTAPEPSSLILIGTGLSALALRRKSMKAPVARAA